jgi:hypothetical protein
VPLLEDSEEESARVQAHHAGDLDGSLEGDGYTARRHVADYDSRLVTELTSRGSGGQAALIGGSTKRGLQHLRRSGLLEREIRY